MDYKEIIKKVKPEFEKVMSFLERELAKIRTGRASASLVEDIIIDCFGQKLPLKQLATIASAGRRELIIQPWDKSCVEAIEKTLNFSNLGGGVASEGGVVRVSLPPLSEEYRQNLLRTLSEKAEECRRTIRHWREEAWKETQEGARAGQIREDDKYRAKDELQKLVDEYQEKIEKVAEQKKREIME